MKIRAYEVYRENEICTLKEEKTYETTEELYTINNNKDLFKLYTDTLKMDKLIFERMVLICIDSKQKPRAIFEIGNAAHDYYTVSESAFLTKILLSGCYRFFMVHNHPSGLPNPSEADIEVTKRIKNGADLLDIKLLDHMIIGNGYYSFKEAGLLT